MGDKIDAINADETLDDANIFLHKVTAFINYVMNQANISLVFKNSLKTM